MFDRKKDILVVRVWACLGGPWRRFSESICEGEKGRERFLNACVSIGLAIQLNGVGA